MERVAVEMSQDEMMWGRFYNKEEEEKLLRESIIQEERNDAEKQGFAKGLEHGIEQGIEQTQKEIITNMKEIGMTLENISKITKMDISKIKELLENK